MFNDLSNFSNYNSVKTSKAMEETITTQKQRKRGGSDEEMIDVREPANQLMQRIAKLHPSVYPSHLPHYRSDTIEYISSKSASTRRMVNDTERVRCTMKKARDELDILERYL